MRKYNSILPLKWMLSLLLVAGLISCADEDIVSRKVDVVEGINTEVSLLFNSAVPSVQSRGALEIQQEYKVHNLYVFVFNNETGKKEYGHLFELNAENDADKLLDVEEKKSETGPTTSGSVKMKIPSGEKRIYAVANVPLDDSHASMENLDNIESITDLENNVVSSSPTVARPTGKLVMSGWLETDSQQESDPKGYCIISPTNENSLSAIKLVRVDARVTFNVSLDKEKGEPERGETIIERRFTPNKYLVKNVPTKAYLYSKDDNVLVKDAGYFSSNNDRFVNFEIVEDSVSSFTFYMMENKQTATGLEKYEQREEEYKNPSTGENKGYKFAPPTATLVEITGYYFEKYEDRDGLTKERHADVKYTIHLGYVDRNPNDFRCKRNTTYIYNVYVQSVNKIRLEVTSYNDGERTTVEEQPGAEGNIVETDKYYQFDSHYDRMLVTFNKKNIAGRAGFRVKTPFDDGYYCIKEEEGITYAKPLSDAKDYKWIKFRRHSKNKKRYKYIYDKENYADFNPGEIITIDKLLEELHTKEESIDYNSIYDSNGDAVYTMFIDEYYYPCDPRKGHYGEYNSDGWLTDDATDKEGTDFWKEFVNQPNREIHILCNTQYSQDRESSLTTSAVMVSQRSIKTFYNERNRELETAWGLETINETGPIEPGENPWDTNNSSKNGLWNFFEQTNYFKDYRGGRNGWAKYISSEVKKDNNGVHDYMDVANSKKLLYACLQRNRDENGDGYIDETEVKWYPASINQYTDIWIGTPALPAETYLYSNVAATEQGYKRYLSSDGKEFYAEEGSSIGGFKFQYANSITGKPAPTKYDYRCLRNLGKRDGKPASADDMPQHYVSTSTSWDSEKVTLSLSFINSAALRTDEEYLKGEITAHDENSNLNRPYLKFEFKTVFVGDDKSWNGINSQIDADTKNSPCAQFNINLPAGEPKWRLPNQRELSLMTSNYDSWEGYKYVQSRTRSSLPEKKKNNIGYSGGRNENKPFISLADSIFKGPVRCVRDVK